MELKSWKCHQIVVVETEKKNCTDCSLQNIYIYILVMAWLLCDNFFFTIIRGNNLKHSPDKSILVQFLCQPPFSMCSLAFTVFVLK